MKRLCIFICSFLLSVFAVTPYAAAQLCPEPGGGADVVEVFKDACDECERGPVLTCREDFSITLIDIVKDAVTRKTTFIYEVQNTPDTTVDRDLAHWVLGIDLDQLQLFLADGKTLSDLFETCSVGGLEEGMDCGLVIPDPTTQLDGMKFEAILADGESQTFRVTFDETALIPGNAIGEGCVIAATKAGDEDIQRTDRQAPGYVCISGPVLVEGPSEFVCPRSQGYWKNHPAAWPVESLELGCQSYSKTELLTILNTPPRGDASLILAKQLIAAKLNIENGSDPGPVAGTIESADELLCGFSGKLPYRVRTYILSGHQMVRRARVLDAYNNRWLTPNCGCHQ